MEPTIRQGDTVAVRRDFDVLSRGDISLHGDPFDWESPEESSVRYVRRVMGLPGETVEGREGSVFINNKRLDEPYLAPETQTDDFWRKTVPPDHYWVMGDNRGRAVDSRVFGALAADKILGLATEVVGPPDHRRSLRRGS